MQKVILPSCENHVLLGKGTIFILIPITLQPAHSNSIFGNRYSPKEKWEKLGRV